MMRGTRTFVRGGITAIPALLLAVLACAQQDASKPSGPSASVPSKDPLAAQIERDAAFLQSNAATGGLWDQVRKDAQPVLARAEEDLRQGRRTLALQRLANARVELAAATYVSEHPEVKRTDQASFETEWARMGKALRDDLGAPSPAALEDVEPAALRALGEAALPQVRALYDASLGYGRNAMADSGLYYLGHAQAQREIVALSRELSTPTERRAPPVRALDGELAALQGEMLAAYRPPASVEKHGDFITASATLKEAQELNAAGLRYGALLRYLQAAQQFAPIRPVAPLDAAALTARLREYDARLSAGDVDHSIGRMFLEAAQAEVAGAAQGAAPPAPAVVIASDLLPRYFAALEPTAALPKEAKPAPAPQVTVTLVRWPYT